MTKKLNSCPVDNGQLQFVGISRHITGRYDEDSGNPIIDHFRWQDCSTCGVYTKEDFFGTILLIQKEAPNEKWFKVPSER